MDPAGAVSKESNMMRTLMSGKIHRATVTAADVDYVGSITVDQNLLAAAGIMEGEQVHVVDINNGARLVTYAISGEAGSGVIGINGAAARLVHPGDLVIIIAYGQFAPSDLADYAPRVVHVDDRNRIAAVGSQPGPAGTYYSVVSSN